LSLTKKATKTVKARVTTEVMTEAIAMTKVSAELQMRMVVRLGASMGIL
jgi:hypothetical protein